MNPYRMAHIVSDSRETAKRRFCRDKSRTNRLVRELPSWQEQSRSSSGSGPLTPRLPGGVTRRVRMGTLKALYHTLARLGVARIFFRHRATSNTKGAAINFTNRSQENPPIVRHNEHNRPSDFCWMEKWEGEEKMVKYEMAKEIKSESETN